MSSTEISTSNGEVQLTVVERVSPNSRDSQIGSRLERQRIHRVIEPIRRNNAQLYDPAIVSIGPYHHGKPNLKLAELYKPKALKSFIECSSKDKASLCTTISEFFNENKSCYKGIDDVEDKPLIEMMLLDTCFVIHFLQMLIKPNEDQVQMFEEHFQTAVLPFICTDLLLLENQIPLQLLMKLGGEVLESIICDFLKRMIAYDDENLTSFSEDDEAKPYHLLEALRRVMIKSSTKEAKPYHLLEALRRLMIKSSTKEAKPYHLLEALRRLMIKSSTKEPVLLEVQDRKFKKLPEMNRKVQDRKFKNFDMTFSVNELRVKGIYFKPAPSNSLTDFEFTSYVYFGTLRLPVWFINKNTKQFFTNIIAHEATFGSKDNKLPVTSYIIFMKSLIKCPEDVKELREKNIIYSDFGSDSKIVELIQEIDTFENAFAYEYEHRFPDVRYKIGEYCREKRLRWMAESFHTNFRTIALLATAFLLCLTFLQTYFTINPAKEGSTQAPV